MNKRIKDVFDQYRFEKHLDSRDIEYTVYQVKNSIFRNYDDWKCASNEDYSDMTTYTRPVDVTLLWDDFEQEYEEAFLLRLSEEELMDVFDDFTENWIHKESERLTKEAQEDIYELGA